MRAVSRSASSNKERKIASAPPDTTATLMPPSARETPSGSGTPQPTEKGSAALR
jgi:hypothetical protein